MGAVDGWSSPLCGCAGCRLHIPFHNLNFKSTVVAGHHWNHGASVLESQFEFAAPGAQKATEALAKQKSLNDGRKQGRDSWPVAAPRASARPLAH